MKTNKIKTNIIVRQSVVLLFLLMIPQIAFCDNQQDKLNLDYFRTPEAAAFMKYGVETVNEYTGTADISVPLYTIKSKDVEIPLVLRYDASGIKVEQEASWVGLGWNLMVGGCINYVCAGSHDKYTQCTISDQTWMEYLTTMYTFSGGRQYFHYATDNKNTWMESVPHAYAFDPPYGGNLSPEMKNYLLWGYGERDFYSVNVLGKSFKFFIDPVSLRPYVIGEVGEDFKIEPYYKVVEKTGIGNQPDVYEWTITDSDGYVYHFGDGDKLFDEKGWGYTSSWYLTEIQTPMGETIKLSYTKLSEWNRAKRMESYSVLFKSVSVGDMAYGQQGYTTYSHNVRVNNPYLNEIKTSNQTVTFTTSASKECSGRRLDAITVKSNFGDKPVIKTFRFSYSSFGHSNIGGNTIPASDATAELRLKLNNVKEVTSSETHTTSFAYNSKDLPSKRSCAQDFWGYYNGQDNPSTNGVGFNGHTLLPAPRNFMTKNYHNDLSNIKGADRFSCIDFMQAAVLNKVIYPTGGYTTYEYEANSILTNDFTLTKTYRDKQYDVSVQSGFTCYPNDKNVLVADQSKQRVEFTLTQEATCDLLYQCSGSDAQLGQDLQIQIYQSQNMTLYKSFPLKFIPNSQNPTLIQNLTLPAGKYVLMTIPINDNKKLPFSIRCFLEGWYKGTTTVKDYKLECGGLRIKRINNFDADGKKIDYTTYDYNDSKGTTGILLNEIETIDIFNYTYLKLEPDGWGIGCVYSRHPINGHTITTGQSRFPAFYESCNPGIMGYSQVTKRKYSANGSLEKSVITSYINHKPKSMSVMDYYDRFDNGKILWQETRDANGKAVMKVENEYRFHDYGDDANLDKWYSTNMQAVDQIRIDPAIKYINEYGDDFANRYKIWKYPYILSWAELKKTTTTETGPNGNVVSTKEYKYNLVNHQVSQIDEKASLPNQFRRTKITYSADGTDNISKSMKNAHWLNNVIENKVFLVENNQEKNCISTQHTYYDMINSSSCFLPKSYATSIGSNALETRAKYSYDKKGNISSIEVDGIETVYIWSYLGQYPIAKIEGLTLAKVKTAVSESTINSLLDKAAPTASDLSSLRTKINSAGGHITTYTFKPLVGIASETLPNGLTVNYEYDAFGRLTKASDPQGVMQKYQYNYKVK